MAKTKKGNPKDKAVELLVRVEALNAEIAEIMEEFGVTALQEEVSKLKAEAVQIAVEENLERIDLPDGRYYGLRRDTYNKRIVGDKDELGELKNPAAVVPLKSIVKAKFGDGWKAVWQSITTRRVDENKLARAITNEVLTLDEVQPAYYHDEKSPYLRSY